MVGRFIRQWFDVVWRKGLVVIGYDPNRYRKDTCGVWMERVSYGTIGEYGLEVDHIKPVAKGDDDNSYNLQPLHWRNNRGKEEDYPKLRCSIPAA